MVIVHYDLSVFKLKVEIPALAFLLQVGLDKYIKEKTLLFPLMYLQFLTYSSVFGPN